MAKRKRAAKRPQPRHRKKKGQSAKRQRLARRNPRRRRTTRPRVPLTGVLKSAVNALQAVLDPRIAFRLAIIVSGMLLAADRRTASVWFAAGGVQDDWDRFYDGLITIGRQSPKMATVVLTLVVGKFDPGPGGRLMVAIDDSPTERYGKHVEGAGVHHDPTPGPAGGEWLYGHNFVAVALLQTHRLWGVIALPLRSLLYVRQVDVPKLDAKYGWTFRTKHELAVELVLWFLTTVRELTIDTPVWAVADGAYAARPFLLPLVEQGVVVVSRLRKDACLFDLPPERKSGQRGRPRIYGENTISLKKRAGHPQGWESLTYRCRGANVTRDYKTFLATSRLTGGVIRVVIVRFEDGWAPYFCTDPTASVQDILEAVADRWAIEEHFHDVKEVWGAGQQQVRNVWSNLGCWQLNQWLFTLVELSCWDEEPSVLSDRRDRPWDNASRRPSHQDRRRRITREMLEQEFLSSLPATPDTQKSRTLIASLISLCV